jgi:bifunctional non-homologous end joining protein LigD
MFPGYPVKLKNRKSVWPEQIGFVPPMLLRRVRRLPEGSGWQYEVKWEGYRMQAVKCHGNARLYSRNGADYTKRFGVLSDAISELKSSTLHLDGELVAMDAQGRPSFQVLQAGVPLPDGWQIGYYAFDLLHFNGRDLIELSLSERRLRLEDLLNGSKIRFSPCLDGSTPEILQTVRQHRLEGVVAKRMDSQYQPGKRSSAWIKLPLKQEGRFLIGGFRPYSDRGALLLVGRFENGQFRFAGKVRQGLNQPGCEQLLKTLKRGCIRKCPFADIPNCKQDPFDEMVTPEEMDSFIWVRPGMAVEISYGEWTRMGALRHAELVSLRTRCLSQGP